MPKVSVLMPVYKTNEQYLREAIESILNQTFTDFELLIVDDCPAEPRADVVKSYQDPRIKYYQNECNLGISEARNRLLDLAQGEYLAVFDHDDISLPTRLEKEVTFLDQHPDYGVVSCQSRNIVSDTPFVNPCNDAQIRVDLMQNCVVLHPACMLRKSVLDQHQIRYEEHFSPSEDHALFCRLIPYTKFCNLNEVLFLYRDHEGNTSHLQQEKMQWSTSAVRAIARHDYPSLYQLSQRYRCERTKYKLFGRISLFTVYRTCDYTRVYLFHKKILLIELRHYQDYRN